MDGITVRYQVSWICLSQSKPPSSSSSRPPICWRISLVPPKMHAFHGTLTLMRGHMQPFALYLPLIAALATSSLPLVTQHTISDLRHPAHYVCPGPWFHRFILLTSMMRDPMMLGHEHSAPPPLNMEKSPFANVTACLSPGYRISVTSGLVLSNAMTPTMTKGLPSLGMEGRHCFEPSTSTFSGKSSHQSHYQETRKT